VPKICDNNKKLKFVTGPTSYKVKTTVKDKVQKFLVNVNIRTAIKYLFGVTYKLYTFFQKETYATICRNCKKQLSW